MNLTTLDTARNDLVALVMRDILLNWMTFPEHHTWKNHLEVAYHQTRKLGTTIGVFSNLPGQLGERPEELPFLQVQAERLPMRLREVEAWKPNFGLNQYLGDRYVDCVSMTAPFLTYAGMLFHNKHNRLWSIEVGDWRKQEPLVLTFESRKDLVKVALWGHVLVRDAQLIADNTPAPLSVSIREDYWAHTRLVDYSEERILHELISAPHGHHLYDGDSIFGELGAIGTYSHPRLENDLLTVDVHLIRPRDYEHMDLWITIIPRQVRDPKRSQNKYKRRYITPHWELEVRLLGTPIKGVAV